MQKQMLMEQENRAVIEELEEKCAEVAELESENHNLNQRIVKLEEEIQQEQHKYNLQKIDLDNVKETATKEIDSSRGLKDQHNSLKTDELNHRLRILASMYPAVLMLEFFKASKAEAGRAGRLEFALTKK